MKWFIIIGLVFVASACTSYDALTYQNMERAWEVRDQDKRPVISDEQYENLRQEKVKEYMDAGSTEEEALHLAAEFLEKRYLPQSLDDAREFEKEQALRYERSKE